MTRRRQRVLALGFLFALAGGLVYFGFQGLTLDFVPAQYIGYAIGAFGVVGLFGLNIWAGGPLDPRNDPPEPGRAVWREEPPA